MKDIIRDSTVGQLINSISGGRYLPYADQRSDYAIPAKFLLSSTSKTKPASIERKKIRAPSQRQSANLVDTSRRPSNSLTSINFSPVEESIQDYEKGDVENEPMEYDHYVVGWNGDDDPENPRFELTRFPALTHSSSLSAF
jgi:MFS transporter, DHA1 family, multidrug resistance protein